jgi:hypothetical protein
MVHTDLLSAYGLSDNWLALSSPVAADVRRLCLNHGIQALGLKMGGRVAGASPPQIRLQPRFFISRLIFDLDHVQFAPASDRLNGKEMPPMERSV